MGPIAAASRAAALLALLVAVAGAGPPDAALPTTLWPPPQQAATTGSPVALSPSFTVKIDGAGAESQVLQAAVKRFMGRVGAGGSLRRRRAGPVLDTIVLDVASSNETLAPSVNATYAIAWDASKSTQVSVAASTVWGGMYGLETLSQCISAGHLNFTAARIRDWPDYDHRGLMVDSGRRFVPVETLQGIIDGMVRACAVAHTCACVRA